jgi:hypothetical protein
MGTPMVRTAGAGGDARRKSARQEDAKKRVEQRALREYDAVDSSTENVDVPDTEPKRNPTAESDGKRKPTNKK